MRRWMMFPSRNAHNLRRRQSNFMNEAIKKMRSKALAFGVLGTGATIAGYFIAGQQQFFQSWLIGFLYVFAFACGGMGFLMIHHLAPGKWSLVLQRLHEAATRTFPLILILFIPVIMGMNDLYPWINPSAHNDHVLEEVMHHKGMYLNVHDFFLRAAIYFVIWMAFAALLSRWSRQQDASRDTAEAEKLALKMRMLSGIGLVIFGLAVTFASFDWAMSVEPKWYSTVYGAMLMMAQGVATLSLFAIIAFKLASSDKQYGSVIGAQQYHDIGNMMFAFLVLFTYLGTGELIILWSGNLPEEIEHYIIRMKDPWTQLIVGLTLLHFTLPFLIMLWKSNKRNPRRLSWIAAWLLVTSLFVYFWYLLPPLRPEPPYFHWMDFTAPIGLFGLWLFVFLGSLSKRPLLPQKDPRFPAVVAQLAGKSSGSEAVVSHG